VSAFSPERLRAELEGVLSDAGAQPTGELVALSGGLDSSVLLAALSKVRVRPLRAIHVDHGLQPDAALWSAHSVAMAAGCGVSCEVVRVNASAAPGESPEAAARVARYAALAGRLLPGEALLTAHHGDDQLETVLLQWLRGGGLRAVAGLRPVAPFAAGWRVRPLLGFTRNDLADWARGQGLEWLEDPSNADPRFDRNFLRLEVLPVLRSRWPAAARTVGRVAAQAAEALDLEAILAAEDLAGLAAGDTLLLARLEHLPQSRQRLVLRAWLRARGIAPPPAATLESLRRDMLAAAPQRIPETRWPGAVVRRYRGRLYATQESAAPQPWQAGSWSPGTEFSLGGHGRLALLPTTGDGLSRARLPGLLTVTARPPGASFRPAGGEHRRELRKWLQEQGVLPWQRAALPCILAGDEVVAVGDLACGGALAAAPGEPAWRVAWHGRPTLTEAEALAGARRT